MRHELGILLRGAPEDLRRWIDDPRIKSLRLCLVTIILAFGIYGMTLGFWRDPKMGLFVGIKMPALILLTLICNGFLNGMLGLLLGSGLGFRQSIMAQLMSFTIAALVLGGLAPVTFFMSLNAPTPDAENAANAHSYFLVTHTVLIALAGIIANLHLAKLLVAVTPDARTAIATLIAWLGGNAFVGAQLSWIMRPFFGTPSIKVAFLRSNPFDGTFYEVFWGRLQSISGGAGFIILILIVILVFSLHLPVIKLLLKENPKNLE
ncbi:hypothetical protein OAL53_00095 [Akkermansiaceae bacterium]|jgi:hypothetical protein|nr:hypothetical protein [Verrucomicrobiota bacterium]MDA7498886.1 hypothetical protein [Akkermansiaceae bacterium]MDB4608447.1 hypothetical protein [bacterium]MBT7970952.1 hypothetical protein [Verrucomicrobiota bacterium]MDA7515311.1 hypothetical protein [Akkermansiaceae bacterium]